jgi:hypothetical protein
MYKKMFQFGLTLGNLIFVKTIAHEGREKVIAVAFIQRPAEEKDMWDIASIGVLGIVTATKTMPKCGVGVAARYA